MKGRSGGHNRLSAAEHELRGTYRPERHGVLAPAAESAAGESLTPELRAFLERGDYYAGGLDLWRLARGVMSGELEGLNALWTEHGRAIKRGRRRETFAEAVLGGMEYNEARHHCHDGGKTGELDGIH